MTENKIKATANNLGYKYYVYKDKLYLTQTGEQIFLTDFSSISDEDVYDITQRQLFPIAKTSPRM